LWFTNFTGNSIGFDHDYGCGEHLYRPDRGGPHGHHLGA
jgi:hypothetical protein